MRLLTLVVTAASLLARAGSAAAEEPPRVLGISHIAVKAADVEKSVAFYRDFLGYAEQGRLNYLPDGPLMLVAMKVSDDQWIEIFDAARLKPEADRLYQIALHVEDAFALRTRLAKNGLQVPPGVPKGQMKNFNFTVKDPSGYVIEFVQYMPDGWTLRDKGKFLPDTRISDHIAHAGVVTRDLPATTHFYADLLGFKESWRGSVDGKELAWVHLKVPDARDFAELMLDPKVVPHFCLEVPDVEKAKGKLEKTAYFATYGRPLEPKVGVNHKRQLNLFDPDGVRVELMEPDTFDGKPVPSSDAPVPATQPAERGSATPPAAERASYERPTSQTVLADLTRTSPGMRHPRLLVTAERFEEVKRLLATDERLASWCAGVRAEADDILTKAPVTYSTTGFSGVLSQARTVLDDAQVLGLTYRLTADRRYAERLWLEVGTVCDRGKFKDWGPSRYGDTVEMATAVALAYDWLYDVWTDEQKRTMRQNLREQCLVHVAKRMSAPPEENGGKKITNIRLVYTGGAATAALAIADEADSAELACDVLAKALRHAEPGMALFAPDGGWYEGARYWGYAVQYHQYLLASLQASTGTTYGLLTAPGFNKTANFPVYLDGPCGNFDFHDDDTGNKLGPQLSWFGRQFNDDYGRLRVAELDKEAQLHQATLREIEAEQAKNTAEGRKRAKDLAKADATRPATVFDVLFYKPAFAAGSVTLPKDVYFRDTETASFRSAWNDPAASFLGVHFGANEGAHAHLDMGSFVFDAQGVRWAEDYGGGSYDWRGYLNSDVTKGHPYRFDYYLARAEGHNTLVINPDPKEPDQNLSAATTISTYRSTEDGGIAVADMTAAYAPRATSVKRGFRFADHRSSVVVQDEVETPVPSDVCWAMHTAAKITISGDERPAILEQAGRRLWVGILSEQPAQFTVVQPPHMPGTSKADYDRLRKLAIVMKGLTEVKLTVMLAPLPQGRPAPLGIPAVKPFSEWDKPAAGS